MRTEKSDFNLFCLDVDGVLTDGTFVYSEKGKQLKTFGPDDADALRILSGHLTIMFVSADERGFLISNSRVEDMGFQLFMVGSTERLNWLGNRNNLDQVIYMGDGFLDAPTLKGVGFGIATSDSHDLAIEAADFVTERAGGRRAVAEACFAVARLMNLHIREFGA